MFSLLWLWLDGLLRESGVEGVTAFRRVIFVDGAAGEAPVKTGKGGQNCPVVNLFLVRSLGAALWLVCSYKLRDGPLLQESSSYRACRHVRRREKDAAGFVRSCGVLPGAAMATTGQGRRSGGTVRWGRAAANGRFRRLLTATDVIHVGY